MDDVVPGPLQRLRSADVIRIAGLTVASLGQEYSRMGVVHSTQRYGARLSGSVDVGNLAQEETASSTKNVEQVEGIERETQHHRTEVEIHSAVSWDVTCTCHQGSSFVCAHAAALIYQWLVDPMSFVTASTSPMPLKNRGAMNGENRSFAALKPDRLKGQVRQASLVRGPMPLGSIIDILGLLPLNELRSIAREYEIAPTGLNKSQLGEAILEAFKRPEAVRHVVGTLEKAQRQLLAALTLAGGSMTDDDLRGLFERFSLGYANQLQGMLNILQKKGLLFRTNLHGSSQQRISLNSSLLDVGLGWYVPVEVRAALHVTLPITPFDVEAISTGDGAPTMKMADPQTLLSDLLLIARALDGYKLEIDDEEGEIGSASLPSDLLSTARPPTSLPADGSAPIPPPQGRPSRSMIEHVQRVIPRSSAFLRFAIRLLRLSDILYKDESGVASAHVLANAAHLLLGPGRIEVVRDLFMLWLAHPGYDELFDLQEQGLRLRSRATLMHHPALRPGELAAENSEARQTLLALLVQVPLQQWVNFSAFARFVYRLTPLFLQRRQRLFPSPHWWFEQEEGHPLHPTQLNEWLRAEGRYLAQLLQGPLYWLGASDIILGADGKLLAFRLTPMMDVLFASASSTAQLVEVAMPAVDPLLEVAETGEILIVPTSTAWRQIEQIERFAEIAGVQQGRLCYRLTPKSLSEALRRGQQPFELINLLTQTIGADTEKHSPLAHLLTQLERWLISYGRVRLYVGATLLEGADAVVMRELSAITSIDEQTVRAIYPTQLILKKQGAETLIEELKRRGQVPLLHDEEAYGAK